MADKINDAIRIPKPQVRPLKVYAFDPSAGHVVGNHMTALVRYEELKKGPVGARFAVIDYDGARRKYYAPVDLNDRYILIRDGLDPSEGDPRFHQQMVYAVASETLQRFETALGRKVPWGPFRRDTSGKFNHDTLFLYPHAMAEANAFYSRDAQAILFGYFRASRSNPGPHLLPGQTVFTCLSHDIIAHEVTHAVVDGIRDYFTEPTNIDVPAFHEAFADISALFSHFSHKEALLDTLQKTGGRLFQQSLKPAGGVAASTLPGKDDAPVQAELSEDNPLVELAKQFGQALGMRGSLREALGTRANAGDILTKTEPHDRGAILVAAVFDAYFTLYTRRTSDLFRIWRAGGGGPNPVDLPAPLADRLARTASATAEEFFTICARALDYCPPVDIVFGDFLRAVLTAHADLHPDDPDGVRHAFMQAFRRRGITPENAGFLSENSICWPQVTPDTLPAVKGLIFGDPNGLTTREQDRNGELLRKYVKDNAAALGFPADHGELAVPSFHPIFRVGPYGDLIVDMVVEVVETLDRNDPSLGDYKFRSGVTLLIWQEKVKGGKRGDPEIHYVIPKHRSDQREQRQKGYYSTLPQAARDEHGHDHAAAEGASGHRAETDPRWRINFGLIHLGL